MLNLIFPNPVANMGIEMAVNQFFSHLHQPNIPQVVKVDWTVNVNNKIHK
jgi:hypothetical protein